ncbi:beta strand repeat-containing protein, partial [Paraburkholderia tropica]|uniref:beta strand repeat-containing protein n=3 Tax=Paraburkholderia tropica TaxID=92647 RepID=UPI0016112266
VTTLQGQITNLNGKLADAVLYDSSSHNSVTLGGVGASTNVKLTNVAAGTLSSTSTDAVNGSQLYATNSTVSNLAGDVTTLQGNVTTLQGNMTTLQGDVSNIAGSITNINGQLADAVAYDSSAHDSVTLGGEGATAPVALHNVKEGELSSTSTDAVNGSQLYTTNTTVSNLAGDVTNLAGDVTSIDGRVTNIANEINNGSIGLVQQDADTRNITVAKDTDGKVVDFTGTAGTRVLTGVSEGELSSTSTDAVNGSQLYATNSNVSNLAGDVTTLQGNVTTLQGNVTTLQGNVTTLQGNMTTLQGDVSNIAGSITNINGQLADAVAYDSSAHDSVTLGGSDASAPVALHNVKEGELSSTSTDAVNGSQLYTTNTTVSNLAGDVTNLAGDVTSIDGRVTNIANEINNGSIGLVQQDADTRNITVAKDTDGKVVDFTGTAGTRVLTGVSEGELSATSTDAVNGSQLYATNSTVSNLAGDVTTLQGNVTTLQGNVTTLQGNVTTLQGDVTTLQGNMTTLQGDVSNIAGSITNINGQLADAVAYDSSAHDSVTLGGEGASAPVALHNVKEGELSSTSTDAVNGSQLYTTNTTVSNLAGDVTNLAGDVTSIDGRVTNIANEINNGSIGLVQQDADTRNITVAKDTDGTIVDFTGTAGTRVLTGVSAGELSSTSTDAVNGSQLYATNSTVSNLAGDVTTLQGNVTTLQGNMTTLQGDVSNIAGSITNINGQLADAVMYDSTSHDSVSLGGKNASVPVALHNVKEGELSSTSTDAVNGSQLYTTNTTVSNLAGDVTNLAGDVTSIDGRVTNIANEINNGSIGLVQQDADTRNITVAKDTDGKVVDFTGTAGTRVLTGVSEGELSSTSKDAVNGSQLYTTNTTVSNLAGDVTTLQGNVTTLQGNMTTLQGDVSNIAGSITNINGQLADAVMYDSTSHDSVSLGGADASAPVALHNVKDGEVSASSFDAVNGSQLYALGSSTADALGGGSTVNADGSITKPTYKIGGSTYNNIGDSLTNIDGRVTNIANELDNGSIGLVQQDPTSRTITVAKDTDGQLVSFAGTKGNRVLTGVAPGAVNATSVDAVNGSQLYATNMSVSNLAGTVTTLQGNFTTLQGNVNTLQGDVTNLQGSVTTLQGQMADVVSYDSTAHDSVTLGGSGATSPVKLSNIADGALSETSTDAVNGSQLYNALAGIENVASNGNLLFAADGNRNTESATASGVHATAGGANSLASGENSTAMGAASQATGKNSTALGANSTASAEGAVALGAGSVADRDNTVSVGSAGGERQIVNVKAGTQGTDAVNVSQLNDAVLNAQSYTTQAVAQGVQQANAYTNQQIGQVRREMNSLGAAAMAASSLIPNARAEGNFQMAVAAGTYGGESALALGANWYVSDRLLLNAHVARSTGAGGSTGASVGATFGF